MKSVKPKKPALKEQLESLRTRANEYVTRVFSRQIKHKYIFQLPPKEDNPANKISIIKVEELYAHVMTARNLGYEVLLTADAGELAVLFIEKAPSREYF